MSYSPHGPQYSTVIYNALYLLGWTIQYWDYLLTFDDEIRYIWQPTGSKGQYWFYLNRYIPFFGNLAVIICNFSPLSPKRYSTLSWHKTMLKKDSIQFYGLHIISPSVINCYSGHRCCKILLAAIIVLWVGCLAPIAVRRAALRGELSLLSLVVKWSVSPHEGGALSSQTGFRLVAAWEASLVYDLVIFVLTLLKSRKRLGGNNLVSLMLRDVGLNSTPLAIQERYILGEATNICIKLLPLAVNLFLILRVILVANASNVITYYVGGPYLKGCLATFSSSVSLTMMNRLILNLRKNTDDVQISILSGSLQFEHEQDNNHTLDSGEGDRRVGSMVEDR
ncbi:hypothetical protein GALMADRAFT_147210 [Galerina marginata CBS 339.88]|uniref:DUF6533 domain-containing protein n=1 Tax=Galerina marginata (strain CBS 339.88) TaxID=685588 RepID=A0A067SL33_GALM3|nr:hypothetical protein GALMADRAFT_147210 [Galerina marginata CBS 339.88]